MRSENGRHRLGLDEESEPRRGQHSTVTLPQYLIRASVNEWTSPNERTEVMNNDSRIQEQNCERMKKTSKTKKESLETGVYGLDS
jgi:hypothetical protein